jgi:hypothetical protein
MIALLGVTLAAALVTTACGGPSDPFTPGGPVNTDPNTSFTTLMHRPDIDQATAQYQQMNNELLLALTAAVPSLTPWDQSQGEMTAACGSDYPGIGENGETIDLPIYVAHVGVTDAQWELALTTIGAIAAKYGFDAKPQRLHDSPGQHDAIFHNVHDDGSITLDAAASIVLGVSLGCHLTAAAKQRGHLSPTP